MKVLCEAPSLASPQGDGGARWVRGCGEAGEVRTEDSQTDWKTLPWLEVRKGGID